MARLTAVEDVVGGQQQVAGAERGARRRARARSFAAALPRAAPEAVGRCRPTSSIASSRVSAWSGERRAGRASAGPARSQETCSLLRPLELRVEERAVAAEVDQVEQAHVGAQLLGGHAEAGAHVGDVQRRLVLVAAAQQVGGERREAREAVDLDVPVSSSPRRRRLSGLARGAVRCPGAGALGRRGVEQRREARRAAPRSRSRRSGRLQQLGVVGQPEHPAEQRAGVGVRRLVHDAAVVQAARPCRSAPSAPRPTRPWPRRRGCAPSRAASPAATAGRSRYGAEVEVRRRRRSRAAGACGT